MARKRFLIIVGLPKSGTTFLYSEYAKRPDAFGMPLYTKEVDYFRRGRDLTQYLSLFDPNGDKVIVDASPLYLDNVEVNTANMHAALEGHDVCIVVCLRDPLERAYSHYLHDVAQNQKITGHADYSFWSPPVLAKYLYKMEPRIRHLQDAFGVDNVHPFAFGQDMSSFEDMLRNFANLEPDWGLDLSSNPAPGFTSPQTFYNTNMDTEIHLEGGRYLLPKGQLLVVNRQFSLLRKSMHYPLAEEITMRQATLTRQCDTGVLSEETRDQVFADIEAASALMGMHMTFDRAPREMHSKPSNSLPDHILSQLTHLGDFDESIQKIMTDGMQPTTKAIVQCEGNVPSLAREMARMQLAQAKSPDEAMTAPDIGLEIIEAFGPIPYFIEAVMQWHVAHKRYDKALALFEPFGGPRNLLWPMDLAQFLRAHNIELPNSVATQFEQAGIRVKAPS